MLFGGFLVEFSSVYKVRIAALNEEGTAAYYLTDQVDSVSHVLDDQGKTLTRIQNDPYGDSFVQRGNLNFSPKFNSQELDQESGFYFYNARYYDASIARFVTPDSIVDGVEDTQGWNRLSYVRGNPINAKDPTGHEPKDYKAIQKKYSEDTKITVSASRPTIGDKAWAFVTGFSIGLVVGEVLGYGATTLVAAISVACPPLGIAVAFGLFATGMLLAYSEGKALYQNTDQSGRPIGDLEWWERAGGLVGGVGAGTAAAKFGSRSASEVGSKIGNTAKNFFKKAPTSEPVDTGPATGEAGEAKAPVNGSTDVLSKIPGHLNVPKQSQHMLGPDYIEGKSILTESPTSLLTDLHAGNAKKNNIIVDFGKSIGKYFSEGVDQGTTQYGTVHYGKNGAHVVPASPNQD